ncbi:MAG: rod shape-determining protein MreC [Nannocystaceae bacterium]|nr:rod shape-determining protein MreC [Myxococcales bacterium]
MSAGSLRGAKSVLLILLLLGIPLLLLRSAAQDPQHLTGLDRAIRRIGGPLEAGVSYAAGTIGGLFSRWVMQGKLQDENNALLAENRELQLKLQELERVDEENRELRRALLLRDKVSEDMIAAAIIGVEQSPFFRVVKLRIDRDQRSVRDGMAVIAESGVVGRVDRSSDSHSDVRLITDPRSKLAVEVARTRAPGILEGAGEDLCVARIISSSEHPVEIGDLIQTSGADEMFPRGHPVGQVTKVEQLVGDQQRVEVVPAVRFDRLSMVWVVLSGAPDPDPEAERKDEPPRARGLGPLH